MDVKKGTPWSELLDEALFLINNSRHRSTKHRPIILEGYTYAGQYPEIIKVPLESTEVTRTREEALINLKQASESREKRYNKRAKPIQVEVGDEVFVRENKNRKHHKFPYKGVVTEVFSNCVKLKWLIPPEGHEKGNLSQRTYAFDQIKVFKKHIEEEDETPLFGDLFGF